LIGIFQNTCIAFQNSKNVLSARHFVGWYNGHPDHVNEEINLDTEVVTVIGHGNVALDVARILLRNLEDLKTTDITDYAFEALKKSQVRKVILAGRRGPLQVSFTIKELREMIKLPGCNVVMNPLDFRGVPELLSSLPRPRKRLLELLCDTALKNESRKEASKTWELKFFRRPKAIICDAHNRVEKIFFGVNKIKGNLEDAQIINTDDEEEVECGLVLRSVGYQSIPIDEYVPFDKTKHIIPNVEGRVKDRAGLYCSGWVKTGPTGVILSTMYGSYETAEKLLEDIKKGDVPSAVNGTKDNVLELLITRGVKYTAFDSWLNIDKVEQERGKAKDKPREKIYHVKEMLQVV
ncbi:NADPH:adrenodoxin oxidoreductase, mitochondrial-like, partial [Stegodyphus dumicola]|uniref:NADPH:adrenodoxin oxidoreductase, mitochondrial-like n=1 Tax=Stegodyphus dumicola TaxID=202533 RepID=UPI0015AF35A8